MTLRMALIVSVAVVVAACQPETKSTRPAAPHRFVVVATDTPDGFYWRSVTLLRDSKTGDCYLATDWLNYSSGAMSITRTNPAACATEASER